MSFTATFILVFFTACFYSFVGYRWGKKDALKKKQKEKLATEAFCFGGVTLKDIKYDIRRTGIHEHCFIFSYDDKMTLKMEDGLPKPEYSQTRFVMFQNDTKK